MNKGYKQVQLVDATGQPTCRRVHLLVLEAFHGSRPEGMQARHLNGIAGDNRLSNLEWGTPRQNVEDRKRHGGYDIFGPAAVAEIVCLRRQGLSFRAIGRRLGRSHGAVARAYRNQLEDEAC